jgi:ATP-dependent RNA helicase RhlE
MPACANEPGQLRKQQPLTSFSDLGLAAPLLKALEGEGYTTPTPIQAKAIPAVLAGSDLLGIAQTGTGKTAAFALPILHRLAADPRPAPRKGCRVLVLSPTRELATQIADSFRTYGRHYGFHVAVVFGGVAHRPQIQALARGVDVLIATPGRLLDHMGERNAVLNGTEILVLDEADQMLDLGFEKPIRRIVSHLSSRRQNLFFSATMPREIAGLANELLRNPVQVSVAPVGTTVERVSQRVIHVEASKKRALLAELFADPAMSRTLVFTRTKRGADRVAHHLETKGIRVAAIHGNKSQRQREQALEAFRESSIRVLVATDIAARGIDIDLVTHVVNFELPDVPEAYVHRIGRTARAGAAGIAISLCDVEEREQLRSIERLTRQSIAAEDRRNDAGLAADQRPASGARTPRQAKNGSGRGHREPRHGHGERHRDHRHGERHREDGHATARHGGAEARHSDRNRNNGHVRKADDRADAPAGIAGVAFLAKPSQHARGEGRPHGERNDGRQHRAGGRNGSSRPRPHGASRDQRNAGRH